MTNFNFGYPELNQDFNFTKVSSGKLSYDFNFGIKATEYKLLFGTNNKFNSIWVDPYSSLLKGRIYIGREEDLTIVTYTDENVIISDYYSTTVSGTTHETLISDNSVDINVVY